MTLFLGIIIGIVIWQTVAFILTLISDLDPDWSKAVNLGIWAIIFFCIVKPIYCIYDKIRAAIFNRTYCRFMFYARKDHNNKLHYCDDFSIKKTLAEKYVTYSKQDIETINEDNIVVCEDFHFKKYVNREYLKEVLTEKTIAEGLRGWSADSLQKFLKEK